MIVNVTELEERQAIQAFAALERELFAGSAWSENAIRQELTAPARTYLMDVDGSTIRGYAGFWYDGDDAELMTIGVGSAYQRQGIASALLRRLIDEAKQQGARRMLLEVRVDNDAALALYQQFGFTRLGLRKRYYQPEGVDAYTMSLDLQPRVVGFQSGRQGVQQ